MKYMSTMEYVQLDNLPRTANDVLNILWDRNRKMTLDELTESVNKEFSEGWSREDILQMVRLLIRADYVEKKRHYFTVFYAALGSDYLV